MTDLRQQLETTLSGTYTLERELGGGGMSRVFVANELRLGRRVVVKVLSPELSAGINVERFEREIKLAASLQQANIVPVLSAGDTNGLPFYTMPFVEGESLRARLGGTMPLTPSQIVRILGDVARALQYAHERGIVHRDIKPDNVLLSGGTAVVTDFGIAKALSASRTQPSSATLTQLGTSIGTPAYMAPEQAAGDPNVDARADIYAFGCMAYELLAGHPPFHGRTPQRVLAAQMGERPQPIDELVPGISPVLADLVMACLAKDAEARPQSAAEVERALDSVTSASGMRAMPAVLMHGPAAFRKALVVYVLAAAAVAIVARAATIAIGLPDWVLPGAIVVMALGLPVILFTGYVQSVTRRALTATPRLTPGGGARPQGTMATIALKASPHVSWQRAARGGLIAIGGFTALIAGFMIMRALGIGPAASLFASGTLKARDPIMIADFDVSRADSSVASVVAEAVRTNLSQSPSIVLATPVSIAGALERMQRPINSRLSFAVAREVAERQGYKAIVTGDVTGLGSGFVIALRLVTPDSGAVLASYQTTANGPADLVSGVDVIAKKLREKMGESLKSVQASPPLEQVSTASIEALRAYTLGTRANDIGPDHLKAVEYLRRAVALDGNFAMAWRKLAVALDNQHFPHSSVDSAITRAHELPARLTERERLLTEAYYYESGPGRDRARAVAAYEQLVKLGDTAIAGHNLAVTITERREFARADSLFSAAIRVDSDDALGYINLVPNLEDEGRRADEVRVLEEMRKRFPGDPHIFWAHFDTLYNDGHSTEAAAAADTARLSSDRVLRVWGLRREGDLARLHGQLRAAESWYRQANSADSAAGIRQPSGQAAYSIASWKVWYAVSSPSLVQELDSLAPSLTTARSASDRDYAGLAAAYSRAGRPDKARAALARMRTEVKDTALLRSWEPAVHLALGEIAVSEQRGAEAVGEFRKADRLPDGPVSSDARILEFNLGRAFDVANQPDSSIAHFGRFLTIRPAYRLEDDSPWLAGVYKRLGELYEAKGDATKAESYLGKFVDLWAHADPELQPKVTEARQRLARLREREGR